MPCHTHIANISRDILNHPLALTRPRPHTSSLVRHMELLQVIAWAQATQKRATSNHRTRAHRAAIVAQHQHHHRRRRPSRRHRQQPVERPSPAPQAPHLSVAIAPATVPSPPSPSPPVVIVEHQQHHHHRDEPAAPAIVATIASSPSEPAAAPSPPPAPAANDPEVVTKKLINAVVAGSAREISRLVALCPHAVHAVIGAAHAGRNSRWPFVGHTLLMTASWSGALDKLEALLAAGADPHVVAPDGRQALHLAALRGHVDIVRALLAHRADPNCKNALRFNQTPLHIAAIKGYEAPRVPVCRECECALY